MYVLISFYMKMNYNLLFSQKKGKSEAVSSAATLILIIGIILLLYILFLPPTDREDLLNGNSNSNSNDDDSSSGSIKTILLDKAPGFVENIEAEEYRYNIPAFNLLKSTNSKILVEENSFFIKKSWFSENNKEISFDLLNLDETNNVLLSFNTPKHKGRIIIILNGNEIFNKEISKNYIDPIEINSKFLEKKNDLTIKVMSPDWKFWDSNYYEIDNFILTADVSDSSNLEGFQTFFVPNEESKNLKNARLIFTPICQESKIGKLYVDINENNIYSSVPDCESVVSIDFSTDYIKSNNNEISFRTTQGRYLIDTISIKTETSDSTYPTYYFELSNSQYNEIINNNDDINLSVTMLDDDKFKEAYIYINDRRAYIDSKEPNYEKEISSFVIKGTNTLQIRPKQNLEVVNLKVIIFE
jgi:hypothetical protein